MTTAVASRSRPAKAAATRRNAPTELRSTSATLVGDLAPQRFDVLLVALDAFLERLQPLLDARIVALVAAAHRLLLGERLARLGERGLLAGELLLQDLALAPLAGGALGARFARKIRWRRGRPRRLLRRADVDLARHQLALLLLRLAPVVGVGPMPLRVAALEDLRELGRRRHG